MKKKWLRCSSCGAAFDTLKNLNSHIVKTGCNNSVKLSQMLLADSIGFNLKKLFHKMVIVTDLSVPIKNH